MTDYDFFQICKLLQNEDIDITNRLISLENTYQIFHRFDSQDFLELLELKLRQQYQAEFEVKLLRLCNYLIQSDKEVKQMFSATVYIESDGKIEKLSASFETKSDRDNYLIDKILSNEYSYLIANGEPEAVPVHQILTYTK